MRRHYVRTFAVVCGSTLILTCMLGLLSLHHRAPVLQLVSDAVKLQFPIAGFLVNTPGCQIPDVDPFDTTVRHLISRTSPISCNATPAMTYIDRDYLRINITALQLYYGGDLENCLYQNILRPEEQLSDDLYKYGNETVWFSKDIQVKSEYIRVACYSKQTDLIYTNFHAFVLPKPGVEKKCDQRYRTFIQEKNPSETLNLLVIGVDSVSRLNFMRQMPKTRRFLVHDLGAIELKGYNKVADNTYVNLVPMFAGKFVEELPWDESSRKPFDEYNFIWKNFSAQGYRTLYAEDAPMIAIFNYAKEGFYKPPTDYYLRPFSLAMEDHGAIWRNNHDCVGPKLETEVVLDYVHDFMKTFKQKPFYAFSFITRLTHDNINKAGAADQPYFDMFTQLYNEGYFDNTVLLFFSDHGMRFGPIRKLYIGKLEERLPFMFIVFPKWFYKKYPDIAYNLRLNENRLTTPFDIYETLADLLKFEGTVKPASLSKRGLSLFSAIPGERTCEAAAILPHWCTCHQQKTIETDNPIVVKAVKMVIHFINQELQNYKGLCVELFMENVTDSVMMIANDDVLRFKDSLSDVIGRTVILGKKSEAIVDYLLNFRTSPGGGLFEVTVRHSLSDDVLEILGDISRINEYGSQSHCIDTHKHKKYCYCTS